MCQCQSRQQCCCCWIFHVGHSMILLNRMKSFITFHIFCIAGGISKRRDCTKGSKIWDFQRESDAQCSQRVSRSLGPYFPNSLRVHSQLPQVIIKSRILGTVCCHLLTYPHRLADKSKQNKNVIKSLADSVPWFLPFSTATTILKAPQ